MNTREKHAELEEIRLEQEREDRMNIIAQNGNDGLHYEKDILSGFNTIKDFEVDYTEVKATDKALASKGMPVYSGVLKYFPNALKEVSKCSKAGNDQHHPDKPLHWDKTKSTDNEDALVRHLIDHTINPIDDDGQLHLAKVAWRALASLEIYLENNEL